MPLSTKLITRAILTFEKYQQNKKRIPWNKFLCCTEMLAKTSKKISIKRITPAIFASPSLTKYLNKTF